MITQIEVNGFKSLSGFKLNLNPGLNVLVGPNGSGKTNIVALFEFLAHLIESDLAEATSFLGGAGAIQRRVGNEQQSQIVGRAIGGYPLASVSNEWAQLFSEKESKNEHCVYCYDFTILFTGALDPVIFAKQSLRYKHVKKPGDSRLVDDETTKWDLDVEYSLDSKSGNPILKVKAVNEKGLRLLPFLHTSKGADAISQIEELLGRISSPNLSLPKVLAQFSPLLMVVCNDIAGGQAFNIIPSRVRLAEDSARPPGISSDGSGFSTTLYAIKRRLPASPSFNFFQQQFPGRQRGIRTPSLQVLKAYFQMANKAIDDFTIGLDSFSNQVRILFEMKSDDYHATIPLSLMSDGTLKWLTLITAALTAQSVFSIEEPENYLHPNMQAQAVNILRDILVQENKHGGILMTTHSETLLNNCTPGELIIVNFEGGRTVAHRCANEADVSDEISRTGFGLGYYYLNNALQHE